METWMIYAVIFALGLFAGLYIGKCGELRRLRKNKGGYNNNQKNNQKINNVVEMKKPENRKAAN
jgi:hypothetical protein